MLKYSSLLVIGFLVVGCKKAESPRDVFKKINKAIESKNESIVKSCFTKETLELMAKIDEMNPEDKPWIEQMMEIGPEPEPEVLEEKIEANDATLKIKVADKEQEIHFKIEDGVWKIDLSKELRMVLEFIKAMQETKEKMEKKTKKK